MELQHNICQGRAITMDCQNYIIESAERKRHKGSKSHKNKKRYGKSISERPEIAALRTDEGHWEGDTVVGKKAGKEAVILSLLEKKTEHYIAIQIPGKDSASVLHAMQSLRNERHNGLFRAFVPKGVSIELFSPEYILSAANELNGRPRKSWATVPLKNCSRHS